MIAEKSLLETVVRAVVADLSEQLRTPAWRKGALYVISDGYPNPSARYRARAYWTDKVRNKMLVLQRSQSNNISIS